MVDLQFYNYRNGLYILKIYVNVLNKIYYTVSYFEFSSQTYLFFHIEKVICIVLVLIMSNFIFSGGYRITIYAHVGR
jgi:hypothetical protein